MLNGRIDKKDTVFMSQYFLKPNYLGANVKVKYDLSNYATKADLKKGIWVVTSIFDKRNWSN